MTFSTNLELISTSMNETFDHVQTFQLVEFKNEWSY